MNSTLNYTNATELLEQGKDKDAYAAFLSVVELSTQQLHGVKFVHQTIISKPSQYEDSMALLRSCLDQLEKIAIQKLPGAIQSTTKTKSPPPVPPKPSLIHQKPTIPPRPKKVITPNDINVSKRSRGNSVSFAGVQQNTIIENDELPETINKTDETGTVMIEEDDDDDDDVVIEFENTKSPKRPSTINNTVPPALPARTTRGRSKSWVVSSNSTSKRNSIDVLLETVVDPSNLVPAQTNTGDSLAIPNTSQTTDYVPNIPAPPLLATHRRLHQRLNELETDLENCKEAEGFLRSERNHKVVCARQTLEKVRTLYMSAMTIPDILQFPPHLTAYQLTIIESSIFRVIPRQALLSHSGRTPHRKIVASTDFFNFMTRSIEHSILLPQEASKRAEIIHRWIKIATKLLSLNNYQTLKAVISALGTPPVQRLKRTWECIPKKRMASLELLSTLMSETDNYQRYREHVGLEKNRLWSKPVVPFLGVFIHDITYIHAACKGNIDDSRIQDVLNNVQLFQKAPEYPHIPPASFNTTKKHLFRSSLHFGSSSTKNTNRVTTAALMGEDQRQETETELEQQLIVQYILMRSWVSEKTIDALSNLREPSKPRPTSPPITTSGSFTSPTRPSSNVFSISPSVSTSTNAPLSLMTNSSILSNNGPALSSTSSFMRFNSLTSTSIDAHTEPHITSEETKKSLTGFWPFRKSTDISRNITDSSLFVPQEQNWSEDEDDEDDESDISNKHGHVVFREKSTIGATRGHNRSISLPVKSILVSDTYK
ncbi:ras guanine nucleotide exchange factor domain-containing protein [Mucor mucedo]|uniref:ras guanine nucleotide exchange factor domain-containing protein n=1 Tax=Mucor mucedo TaxID=29922 RepID=UPI0022212543|nr:ras guanine nucleotide exchange factor domain-containing protein [Mucor mucedo]KAI7892014.1 ras guanine nucleotide exchange factor domain-containing protein [Mucor mucedo]